MKIAVIGTGYVGLVSGACLAETGHDVTCVDVDAVKIDGLNRGIIPIYEPGLDAIVADNIRAGRLRFSTDANAGEERYDIIMCAVGTPPGEDGSADLRYVLDVARNIGRTVNGYTVFVTKSTVPVGTGAKIEVAIREELDRRGIVHEFDVVSNPEFLKEGDAVRDFMHPDRIIAGTSSERASEVMRKLYEPFIERGVRVMLTDVRSAEMIKYASNAMLATRISFMNDIANLCGLLGADVAQVREGIGADSRIGDKFLNPGIGYGGSCFPKDVKALIRMGLSEGYDMQVLKAVERVNDAQKRLLYDMFAGYCGGDMVGRTVCLWGLAFKPGTDDMREAPSLVIADLLLKAGCAVRAYDPAASQEARGLLGDTITICDDKYAAVSGADALMLVTEWDEFRAPDYGKLKQVMKSPVIFDGRNIFDANILAAEGFRCFSIGGSRK